MSRSPEFAANVTSCHTIKRARTEIETKFLLFDKYGVDVINTFDIGYALIWIVYIEDNFSSEGHDNNYFT